MMLKMQSAILIGRKIRDNKKISLKTPLYTFTVVETNETVINYLKSLESYIKDELNVLELAFDTNEEKYVEYKSAPVEEIGKHFKAAYKTLKPLLEKLNRE
jgi:isoleucyl-tRNA synthetase